MGGPDVLVLGPGRAPGVVLLVALIAVAQLAVQATLGGVQGGLGLAQAAGDAGRLLGRELEPARGVKATPQCRHWQTKYSAV